MKNILITCDSEDMIHISKFIDLQGNLKTRDDEMYAKIKASIIKYGFRFPVFYVLLDEKNYILDGHGRIDAVNRMIKEGYSFGEDNTLPAVRIQAKDKKEAGEILLALNSHYGKMDTSGLNEFLQEFNISAIDIGEFFEPVEFTFNDYLGEYGDDIQVFDELNEGIIDVDDDQIDDSIAASIDEIEKATKTSVKAGDIIKLGKHTVICASPTEKSVIPIIGSGIASMVFVNIPNTIDIEDYELLLENTKSLLNNDCAVYIATDYKKMGYIWDWMDENLNESNFCVWNKTNKNKVMNRKHWNFNASIVAYGTKGNHVFNIDDDSQAKSVWSFNENSSELYDGEFPVSIPLHAVLHSTLPNQIVVDLFSGSGATLTACEKSKRVSFSVEEDPLLCQTLINRYLALTDSTSFLLNGKKISIK
jgi:hypothetical protein